MENQEAAALGALTLDRASTSEHVARALREAILGGELPPGTPLRGAALAEKLGTSRNTIREAIQGLAREGLVTQRMHRAAEVARLTEEDVADLFNVRRVLEVRGVEATADADDAELDELSDACARLADAVESGDFGRITECDIAFHRVLVGFVGSSRIDRFFGEIQSEVRLCVGIVDWSGRDRTALIAEHRELYELIAAGRQRECRERLLQHLADAEKLVQAVARAAEQSGST